MKTSRPILTLLCILTFSCASWTPAQKSALIGNIAALGGIAAGAYGGPAAAAGLNALGVLLQAYVGTGKPVPPAVVAATPGVGSMGKDASLIISSAIPPTQADAQAAFDAAAALLKK